MTSDGALEELVLARAIIDVQQRIAAADLDPQAVMQIVVETTSYLTAADGAVVELVDGDEMVYAAVTGSARGSLGVRLGIRSSLSGLSVRMGEPLRCDDSESDDRVDREACRRVGLRSMVCVPLNEQGQCRGVLKVVSAAPAAFGEDTVGVLRTMASFIAVSLRHAHEHADSRHRSGHDVLTGLSNRSRFFELVDMSLSGGRSRDADAVTVLYVDLDGFKQVNDTRGHAEGDRVLQLVADRLREVVREGDIVARFGGDEFVIACRGLSDGEAAHVVDRLDAAVAALGVPGLRGASVGIAHRAAQESAEDLVARADAAMYGAKSLRRADAAPQAS